MTIKVGINGFGRIGRLALRAAFDWPELEFVQINDVAGNTHTLAHLLEFDSIQGRWHHEVTSNGSDMIIDGQTIKTTQEKRSMRLIGLVVMLLLKQLACIVHVHF